jgi:hypothetical protein
MKKPKGVVIKIDDAEQLLKISVKLSSKKSTERLRETYRNFYESEECFFQGLDTQVTF